MLAKQEWKLVAWQISPAHKTIYFSQLLKANLMYETIVSQAQTAFICANSAIIIIKWEICPKLTIKAQGVVLVSVLLTLNISDTLL